MLWHFHTVPDEVSRNSDAHPFKLTLWSLTKNFLDYSMTIVIPSGRCVIRKSKRQRLAGES